MFQKVLIRILSRLYKYFTLESSNHLTTLRYYNTLVSMLIFVLGYIIGVFLMISNSGVDQFEILGTISVLVIITMTLFFIKRRNYLEKELISQINLPTNRWDYLIMLLLIMSPVVCIVGVLLNLHNL